MTTTHYIPALRWHFLTGIYDFVFGVTMPEKRFRNDLTDQLAANPEAKVLEFGAGTASNSILAKKKFPLLTVTGVDVDDTIMEKARQKIEKENVPVKMVAYDGNSLPFEANRYDVVISSLVFHHLRPESKTKAFKEIHRVLKPGGKMIFADWGTPRGLYSIMAFSVLRLFDGHANTYDHMTGYYHMMIKLAGFAKPVIIKRYQTIFGTLELAETTKPIEP